ncbi:zf-HC2 domain-containing protein [Haemophilus haemolyticus]
MSLDIQEKVGLKLSLTTSPYCRCFQRNCETLRKMVKKFRDSTDKSI